MPKGIMVVRARPVSPERDDDLDDWYRSTHIPEVCATPGFVGARRYRSVDPDGWPEHLTVYEIEADDIRAARQAWSARSAAGETTRTDALQLDPPPTVALYELLE